jgi:hypothetical protein
MLRSATSKVVGAGRIASMVFCLALVGFLAMTSTHAEAAISAKDGRITFASDRTRGPGVHNPTGDYELFTANRGGKNSNSSPSTRQATNTQPTRPTAST